MSISDCIVVMKDGLVQQTGKPQQVYDDPAIFLLPDFSELLRSMYLKASAKTEAFI